MASQNLYDNNDFYYKFMDFANNSYCVESYYEWNYLIKLFPNFKGKNVLDLGCGLGSFCFEASKCGANLVIGLDISNNMISSAQKYDKEKNKNPNIIFKVEDLESLTLENDQFDLIFSRFALHYIVNIESLMKYIYNSLKCGGNFIFVIEHPIKTSSKQFNGLVSIDQINSGAQSSAKVWPLSNYDEEGNRVRTWLNHDNVFKQHRTLSTYLNLLIKNGFKIEHIDEILPKKEELDCFNNTKFKSDFESLFMLIIKASK